MANDQLLMTNDIRMIGSVLLLLAVAGCQPKGSVPQGIQVYFSPSGGCTEAVIRTVSQATNSVRVQAYSFTSAPIAQSLVQGEAGECEYAGDRRRCAENNFAGLCNRRHAWQAGGETGETKSRAEDAPAGGVYW